MSTIKPGITAAIAAAAIPPHPPTAEAAYCPELG